jgi:hypothetical protein
MTILSGLGQVRYYGKLPIGLKDATDHRRFLSCKNYSGLVFSLTPVVSALLAMCRRGDDVFPGPRAVCNV